jgi:hypothetical protein
MTETRNGAKSKKGRWARRGAYVSALDGARAGG